MPRSLRDVPAVQTAYERAPLVNLQAAIGMTITIHAAEIKEMPPNKELKAILRTDLGEFVSAQRGIKQQAEAIAAALASDPDPIVAFVQAVEGERAYGNTLCKLVEEPEWNKDACGALARVLGIPIVDRKEYLDRHPGDWPAIAADMQAQAWAGRQESSRESSRGS